MLWIVSYHDVMDFLWVELPDIKVHVAHMGPPGSCRPQVGPMWAIWTLLSGQVSACRAHYHWPSVVFVSIWCVAYCPVIWYNKSLWPKARILTKYNDYLREEYFLCLSLYTFLLILTLLSACVWVKAGVIACVINQNLCFGFGESRRKLSHD